MFTHPLVLAATDLLTASWSAAPAAAHVSVQSAEAGSYTMTGGRALSTSALLLALAGAAIGARALVRSTRRGSTRGSVVALVAGLLGIVGGTAVVTAADGGPGTGNGVAGALMAIALGLLAVTLGLLALIRSRGRADVPTG